MDRLVDDLLDLLVKAGWGRNIHLGALDRELMQFDLSEGQIRALSSVER